MLIVYSNNQTWPVCHILDNTNLYIELLRAMLSDSNPPSGKQGYYLASPGSVAWMDIYTAMARALSQRGVVDDEAVKEATDEDLEGMAKALGCPKAMVAFQLGGL